MSAKTIEASRIAGAIKALHALHRLNQVTKEEGYESSPLGFFNQRIARIRAVTDALGSISPELEGAFSVLIEYVCEDLDGGSPGLEAGAWIPLAAMTKGEIQALACLRKAEDDALDAEYESARKVVSIADWRGA